MRSLGRLAIASILLMAHLGFIQPAQAAGLYGFTTHTFTSCGATGQSGPALANCTSAYSAATWTSSTSNFNVSSGMQLWTVPGTGSYTLDVYGAKGGNFTAGVYTPGQGARVQMTVSLTQGQQIKILVGQPGGIYGYTGGGGGGTFVYNVTTSTLIAVAGGGGAASSSNGNGCNATLTTSGGICASNGFSAGTSGSGGGGNSTSGWGSGGAGYSGDGSASGTYAGASAKSFINGGTGAGQYGTNSTQSCNGAWGGFGGGGGGGCNGGGGGGGYSGGASGGGGGGSYLTGTSQSSSVISGSTAAQVIITATTPVLGDTTSPVITGPGGANGSTSTINVSENTTSVTTFTANETSTWTVSGTDVAFFAIGSSTGVLTITSRDFETKADSNGDGIYVVVVTATDGVGNTTTQTLSVTITDVNEAPVISTNGSAATYAISIAENNSTVATFNGTDVDTGTTLTFSVSGTDGGDFQIGSASGVLVFSQNSDYELPADSDANNSYIIVVTLSDGSLTDTQTVTITVTNATENLSAQMPSLSAAPAKGIVVTLSITVDAAAKVAFLVNGKRIPNCVSKATSGTYPNNIATCSWKPTVTGRTVITTSVTPISGTFSGVTAPPLIVNVARRSGLR